MIERLPFSILRTMKTRTMSFLCRKGYAGALSLGLVVLAGCGSSADDDANSTDTPPATVRVIMIDDDTLGATIERNWNAENRGEIELTSLTAAEFLAEDTQRGRFDAIVYPPELLGELISRNLISELPDHVTQHEAFERSDILNLDRRLTGAWDNQPYAFPLGSPQYVLLYRRDLFDQLGLSVPTTWLEYVQVAQELRDHAATADGNELTVPVAEPLTSAWRPRALMLRAASYIKHRNRFPDWFDLSNLDPLIEREPFVRSLTELQSAVSDHYDVLSTMNPEDVCDLMFDGRCAMALTTLRTADSGEFSQGSMADQVAIARAPGSSVVYDFRGQRFEARDENDPPSVTLLGVDGRLVSVVYLSRRTAAAQEFAMWLAGPDSSDRILTKSSHAAPFRKSHLSNLKKWSDPRLSDEARNAYADIIETSMTDGLWMMPPRIPDSVPMLDILSDQIHRTLSNEADPTAALTEAANRWREINAQHNKSDRLRMFESSLQLN